MAVEKKAAQVTKPAAEHKADSWSKAQQNQLEKGMKDFTAKEFPGKVRWEKISGAVDGKNPKECFERFKEICAKVKNEQATK
jgi:DnaJ family protein C protein 2